MRGESTKFDFIWICRTDLSSNAPTMIFAGLAFPYCAHPTFILATTHSKRCYTEVSNTESPIRKSTADPSIDTPPLAICARRTSSG